jgi:hypothetical protein
MRDDIKRILVAKMSQEKSFIWNIWEEWEEWGKLKNKPENQVFLDNLYGDTNLQGEELESFTKSYNTFVLNVWSETKDIGQVKMYDQNNSEVATPQTDQEYLQWKIDNPRGTQVHFIRSFRQDYVRRLMYSMM